MKEFRYILIRKEYGSENYPGTTKIETGYCEQRADTGIGEEEENKGMGRKSKAQVSFHDQDAKVRNKTYYFLTTPFLYRKNGF